MRLPQQRHLVLDIEPVAGAVHRDGGHGINRKRRGTRGAGWRRCEPPDECALAKSGSNLACGPGAKCPTDFAPTTARASARQAGSKGLFLCIF
jgi:hypothetical protein